MDKEILRKFKQMDNDERKKLMQVLHERKSGNEDKMEWMYKERNIDNEEYLLGRKVDKAFVDATFEQPEAPLNAPGALFTEVIARRSQLDMQLKMKEDPLYVIRQKEMEAKRKVLENPLKMQKLKAIIEDEVKTKKEHKKSKKSKRSRKHSSSSGDEEANELVKKYLAIQKLKKGSSNSNSEKTQLERTSERIDIHERNEDHKKRIRNEEHRTENRKNTFHDSSDEDHPRKQTNYGLEARTQETSYQHKRVDYSNISVKKPVQELPKRRKLTEQEKEEARKQMISNAKQMDYERQQNVRRYKEEEEAEKKSNSLKGQSFLEPLMRNVIAQSSVEDRIKSNRHTIQSSKDNYHKSFVKR